MSAELDRLLAERVLGTPFMVPTHGTCCTCQVCGHPNDGPCMCGLSDTWEGMGRVVEAMQTQGWLVLLSIGQRSNGAILLNQKTRTEASKWSDTVPDAVARAALAALGVAVPAERPSC